MTGKTDTHLAALLYYSPRHTRLTLLFCHHHTVYYYYAFQTFACSATVRTRPLSLRKQAFLRLRRDLLKTMRIIMGERQKLKPCHLHKSVLQRFDSISGFGRCGNKLWKSSGAFGAGAL